MFLIFLFSKYEFRKMNIFSLNHFKCTLLLHITYNHGLSRTERDKTMLQRETEDFRVSMDDLVRAKVTN